MYQGGAGIMKYRYREPHEMKDSGVEWLGMTPRGWKISKLGWNSQMIVPMRDKPKILEGEIPWLRIEDFDGKYVEASKSNQGVPLEEVKRLNLKIFPVGTVLCTCSCTMGKTAIVKKPLVTNQTFIGINPSKSINSSFLYYFMGASERYLNSISTGAIQTYLSRNEFENLKVVFPVLDEQKRVADFLDQKTAEFDSVIEKKKKLIERLEEAKKSLISEVVTGKKRVYRDERGELRVENRSAHEMKDSGVEWLGPIPKEWDRTKLKRVTEILTCGYAATPEYVDGTVGVPFLSAQNIKNGKLSLEKYNYIKKELHQQLTKYKYPRRGDILQVRVGATIGNTCIVEVDMDFSIYVSLSHIRVNQLMHNKYLKFILDSSKFKEKAINETSQGGGVGNLNVKDLELIKIPIPQIIVQQEIADFLDWKTVEFDEVIKKNRELIDKLKEAKQSLISEAVTGKIEIL